MSQSEVESESSLIHIRNPRSPVEPTLSRGSRSRAWKRPRGPFRDAVSTISHTQTRGEVYGWPRLRVCITITAGNLSRIELPMANLHDDAFSGALTATLLQNYLKDAGSTAATLLNSPGGKKNVTPLAGACWGGHLDVVRLLLKNTSPKVDVNVVDSNGRTALFYVCSRSPPKYRVEIATALLNAGASVDSQFSDDDNSTALMVALRQLRDKDLVHLLVDRNASLDLQNGKGQTARSIAKEVGMEQELMPADKRKADRNSFIDYLVSTVMFVVSYINVGMIKSAVKGAIGKIFNFTGKRDTTGVKVCLRILRPMRTSLIISTI